MKKSSLLAVRPMRDFHYMPPGSKHFVLALSGHGPVFMDKKAAEKFEKLGNVEIVGKKSVETTKTPPDKKYAERVVKEPGNVPAGS